MKRLLIIMLACSGMSLVTVSARNKIEKGQSVYCNKCGGEYRAGEDKKCESCNIRLNTHYKCAKAESEEKKCEKPKCKTVKCEKKEKRSKSCEKSCSKPSKEHRTSYWKGRCSSESCD